MCVCRREVKEGIAFGIHTRIRDNTHVEGRRRWKREKERVVNCGRRREEREREGSVCVVPHSTSVFI